MKVKWLGHASFLITSDNGTRIITDPYATSDNLNYGEIDESADIITVSHEHGDHNNVGTVSGEAGVVVRGTIDIKGIAFKGVATCHDSSQGSQRGSNTVFCMEIDGVRLCHLGDLGHPLDDVQVADIGRVDVLLIPVGGFFTIDATVASDVCARLAPRVVIPMHYGNDRCAFPIDGVDDFLEGKSGVRRLDSSEVEFDAAELPASTEIVVLKPAL